MVAADCALCVELFLERLLWDPHRHLTEPLTDSESDIERFLCLHCCWSCRMSRTRRARSRAARRAGPRRALSPAGGGGGDEGGVGVPSIRSALLSPMVLGGLTRGCELRRALGGAAEPWPADRPTPAHAHPDAAAPAPAAARAHRGGSTGLSWGAGVDASANRRKIISIFKFVSG